jgi:sugar diacid utilization regulator
MAEYVTRGQRSGRRRDPSLQQAVRAFGDVAAALSDAPDSPDTDHLLHMIGDRMCDLVGVGRCSVYLRDGRTGLFRGQVGRARSDIDARVKRLVAGTYADQFTREILATRKPVVLSNASNDPRPIRSTMRSWGVSSMLGVPMVFRGEVIGVVYLDDEDGAATFTPLQQEIGSAFADLAAVMIAQTQSSAEMREALETSQRQNQHLRRTAAVDDRLAQSLVEEHDLEALVHEVAEVLGKPVGVYDASWRCRCLRRPKAAGKHPVPDLEDRRISGHPAFVEATRDVGTGRSRLVDALPAAGIPHRMIVAEVAGTDEPSGYVAIVEAGTALHALDAHVARRAAVSVAVFDSIERRLAAAASTDRRVLVTDLLREGATARETARAAATLGIAAGRPHVVCLFATLDPSAPPVTTDAVAAAFRTTDGPAGGDVIVGETPEGVVALVAVDGRSAGLDPDDAMHGRVRAAITELHHASPVVAALSNPCAEPSGYPDAFADARQVLGCMARYAGEGSPDVLAVDDLGAGRLFVATAERGEAERFARRALSGILGEGTAERDLVATLQTFFASARSVRRAALALGVHENTVRYRLARIEELTGLGVTRDADGQLTAELALIVLQLSGVCAWAPRESRPPATQRHPEDRVADGTAR